MNRNKSAKKRKKVEFGGNIPPVDPAWFRRKFVEVATSESVKNGDDLFMSFALSTNGTSKGRVAYMAAGMRCLAVIQAGEWLEEEGLLTHDGDDSCLIPVEVFDVAATIPLVCGGDIDRSAFVKEVNRLRGESQG